jgi:hypothetical protein
MIGRSVEFPQMHGQTREQAARAASDQIATAMFGRFVPHTQGEGKTHAPIFSLVDQAAVADAIVFSPEAELHAQTAQAARDEAAREHGYFIKNGREHSFTAGIVDQDYRGPFMPITAGFTAEEFDSAFRRQRVIPIITPKRDYTLTEEAAMGSHGAPTSRSKKRRAKLAKMRKARQDEASLAILARCGKTPRVEQLSTLETLQRTRGNTSPDDHPQPSRLMSPRAAPIQGRRTHPDGAITDTRVHPDAPGNLWLRIYRTRADFLAGRFHATNWVRRGCMLWTKRPDLGIRVGQTGEVHTTTCENGSVMYKSYRTTADFDEGHWYTMRSGPDPDRPRPMYNADFD